MLSFLVSAAKKFGLPLAVSIVGLLPTSALPAHAQSEIARVPWQAAGAPVCAMQLCRVYFPEVAASRRLDLQFVSCSVSGDAGLQVGVLLIAIDNALSGVRLYLSWAERTYFASPQFVSAQPIDFTISAGHRPQIGFSYGGDFDVAQCTLTGDLVFLG